MKNRHMGYRSPFPNPSGHQGYQRPTFPLKQFRERNLYPRVRKVSGRNTQRPHGMTGSGAAAHSRYTVVALSQNRVAGVKQITTGHVGHVRGTTSHVVAGRLRRSQLRVRQRR